MKLNSDEVTHMAEWVRVSVRAESAPRVYAQMLEAWDALCPEDQARVLDLGWSELHASEEYLWIASEARHGWTEPAIVRGEE